MRTFKVTYMAKGRHHEMTVKAGCPIEGMATAMKALNKVYENGKYLITRMEKTVEDSDRKTDG